MANADCPFCSPDPSHVVARTEHAFLLRDRFPVSPGHLLACTVRHVSDWFAASDAERQAIVQLLDEGRRLLNERSPDACPSSARRSPDGFNVGMNVGLAAGQTVMHLHVHLIPRYAGDVDDPRGGVRHVIPDRGNYLRATNDPPPPPPPTPPPPPPLGASLLVRGDDDPLLPHLRTGLDRAAAADFAVAFVLPSGVALLRDHLVDLLDRGGRLRIVTGDYLGVTDPDALAQLLDLQAAGRGRLELRVFETAGQSFHPKSYIFHPPADATPESVRSSIAYVGSSNLSRTALRDGVEWNYRVWRNETDAGFSQIAAAFESLFEHPKTRAVDVDWLDGYRRRRRSPSAIAWGSSLDNSADKSRPTSEHSEHGVDEPPPSPPEPHAVQLEALAALRATRQAGNQAGLVVLATGLGKTWLAAFDASSGALGGAFGGPFARVLFVAHRDEILDQALHTFRRIRPAARLGRYTGQEKQPDADVLFASIQTLGRTRHLERFARDAFDYIVVDEFHHASAPTYRRLIDHFTPQFLLGLTATPERTDGGDLLGLCQENLVYRSDLTAGIEAGLLSAFDYFGVPDDVDYANIPWRSAKFDESELTAALATRRRADNALDQYRRRAGRRTLGFCCSMRHADFMAEHFRREGVQAAAVHSGPSSAPRASALEALADGRLDVLFAVDMFNEGLDLPAIDTVLMLRPTESSIIWMQQFGRGLRRAEGKQTLRVIDYIGNHRTFLVKLRALLDPLLGPQQGRVDSDAELRSALQLLRTGRAVLPPGCSVTYELQTVAILEALLRKRAGDDAATGYFERFRDEHGQRPTAAEMHHAGYSARTLRATHGSWFGFLRTQGELSASELAALGAAGEFLRELETTAMTKSFKMLTLLAMLGRDALPGRLPLDELTSEFQRVARRSERLHGEVAESTAGHGDLRRMLLANPLNAWCGRESSSGEAWFELADDTFASRIELPASSREAFQSMVRELIDWRLAEYLDRAAVKSNGELRCRVKATGERLTLVLPDRKKSSNVPEGWTPVTIEGRQHRALFGRKELTELQCEEQEASESEVGEELLTKTLRGWFGANAGRTGVRFEVELADEDRRLTMRPVAPPLEPAAAAKAWNRYMREQIPPLFGLEFKTGAWNQGFVQSNGHLFLLVTLEKSGLNTDHRYEDRFVSADRFLWQSQNKTKQGSLHGRLISEHPSRGVKVHLFVRRHKLEESRGAPFVYCGEVDFETWEGERPIAVTWRLREPVPDSLQTTLGVPVSPQ